MSEELVWLLLDSTMCVNAMQLVSCPVCVVVVVSWFRNLYLFVCMYLLTV